MRGVIEFQRETYIEWIEMSSRPLLFGVIIELLENVKGLLSHDKVLVPFSSRWLSNIANNNTAQFGSSVLVPFSSRWLSNLKTTVTGIHVI